MPTRPTASAGLVIPCKDTYVEHLSILTCRCSGTRGAGAGAMLCSAHVRLTLPHQPGPRQARTSDYRYLCREERSTYIDLDCALMRGTAPTGRMEPLQLLQIASADSDLKYFNEQRHCTIQKKQNGHAVIAHTCNSPRKNCRAV
jgi:hypothetical protein